MAAVDGLHSIATEQFGGFEEWSSATSSDGCPGDWSDFHDSKTWHGDGPASPVPAQSTKQLEYTSGCTAAVSKSGDALNLWGVFRECFPAEDCLSDPVDLDSRTPTLSELLRSPSHTQSGSENTNSGAVGVCSRLLCEGSSVRLSGPRPSVHSLSQLVSSLPLVDPKTHNTEDMALPDMELEKTEDPPSAIIKTKLLAPYCCHEAPPFMYQVSLQWLRMCNVRLQAHKHGK